MKKYLTLTINQEELWDEFQLKKSLSQAKMNEYHLVRIEIMFKDKNVDDIIKATQFFTENKTENMMVIYLNNKDKVFKTL